MIELREVRKEYQGKLIFEDVKVCLREGTVTAFVGHNGCGKSTMLKVIAGLIPRSGGDLLYERKYRFSYVPEKFPTLPVSAEAYLTAMGRIDGIYKGEELTRQIHKLAEEFYLENMLRKSMKTLSKGTLQKIGVIQALMSDADVILLDEPLSGQDKDSQEVFVQKILRAVQQEKIVLLSAHEPELIHRLRANVYTIRDCHLTEVSGTSEACNRYVIRLAGKMVGHSLGELERDADGFYLYVQESMLSYEITRLQREGWHIGEVYEAMEHDKI